MFGRQKKERFSLQEHNEDLFLAVVKNLRMVFDPEIPVNVYDLGLIYNLDIDEDHTVYVRMTLTAPNCPEAETINLFNRFNRAFTAVRDVADVTLG